MSSSLIPHTLNSATSTDSNTMSTSTNTNTSTTSEAESTKNSSAATPSTTTTTTATATTTATTSIPSRHWKVGQTRVVDSAGYIGTLVYVGPVASASPKMAAANYAGIVWDDVSRGKHDGSVICRTTNRWVRHFSILPSSYTYHYPDHATPTCASFVPLAKVGTGVALTPVTVLQKYVTTDSTELVAPGTLLPHSLQTAAGRDKPVYFLGEMQIRSQQQVSDLTIVSLRNMNISSFSRADWTTTTNTTTNTTATDSTTPTDNSTPTDNNNNSDNSNSSNSADMIAAWREMDLAGNLLSDWAVVADLVATFDLTALSLAQNRLGNMTIPTVAATAVTAATVTAAAEVLPQPSQSLQPSQSPQPSLQSRQLSWLSAPQTSLRKLNLHGTHISSIDTILQLGRAFPALQELCLAQCDLSGVSAVAAAAASAAVAAASTQTQTQTQTPTPTAPAPLQQVLLAEAFPALQLLDCSQCGLTEWNDQVCLWACLPALQRLSLDDNPIACIGGWEDITTSIDDADTSFDPAARTCDTTDKDNKNNNKNNNKEGAAAAASSSSSSHLNLNLVHPLLFERLQHLQLAGTQIHSWMDVEQLNALTELVSLRLRKCPVLAPLGTGEARGLLIARLPALRYLNASPVTATERVEAEKRYVLQVHRQVLAATATVASASSGSGSKATNGPDSDSDKQQQQQQQQQLVEEKKLEILSQHPQWERLADKHKETMSYILGGGNSCSMPGQEQQPHSLADTVLNVTIHSMAASSCTIDPLIRRLPSGLQVGRLKALCARHFGLDIDLQTLHFRMSTDAFPVAMDDDENTLAYYGVSDGAEILMNEQDVQQKEKQAEREHVDRMEQQELELNNFQERQKRQGGTSIASSVAEAGKPHG